MKRLSLHCFVVLCLSLLMMGKTANGQTLPPVSDPGYAAAKAALVPAMLAAPPPYVPFSTSSLTFADGCFINPDESYTSLHPNDDGSSDLITLPFSFTLYGVTHSSLYLNNNGNITFDAPYSTYSASGFPFEGTAMIAPFWADVDTRTGNLVKYKVDAHRFTATWPGVGYFSMMTDKIDSFQVIITDGTDPEIGIGNNVAFRYGQMNWTTGSASGGIGGFGGTPATVGINAGDGEHYIQVGRFNENSSTYIDNVTPGGVHYLEYNCFGFSAASSENIPPSYSGGPSGGSETIACGTTKKYFLNWIGPETGQLVSSTVTLLSSTCAVTVADPSGFFSVSRDTITIVASPCNVGTHTFAIQGTDNIGAITNDTFTVTVTPLSVTAANDGPVCAGGTLNLSVTSGGTGASYSWAGPAGYSSSSQNPSISGATSEMSGVYTVTVTNGSCSATATTTVTVTTTAITGTLSVCTGGTTTLSAGTGGGSWISGATGVATVNTSTGEVTGVSGGTAVISFYSAGCLSTATVTVVATPGIDGASMVCPGATTTLTGTPSGGTWSSSSSEATVGATSGIVTGVTTGSASIIYTHGGCASNPHHITVLLATDAGTLSGPTTVCAGGEIELTGSVYGGSWLSSNPSVATVSGCGGGEGISVGSCGTVTGVGAGTATISYAVTGECGTTYATHTITVFPLPAAIGGTATVCEGATTTLTSSPGGGSWSSSATIVSVGSTGIVTGVSAGSATITYTVGTGCFITSEVMVNANPTSIEGGLATCVGGTTTLSSTPSGGAWTSGTPSRATVDATTGVVTGVSVGTSNITYTAGTGCTTSAVVSVETTPGAITGSLSLCVGSTSALGSSTTGGTWTSDNSDVAMVSASTGVVYGMSGGTATIMYILGSCSTSAVVSVNAALPAITGESTVCVGQSASLSNAATGGTWSTSDATLATVNASTGLVTGVSTGVVNITYTAGAGCYAVTVMTVGGAVAAISGTLNVCVGGMTTLTGSGSGSWSSSNTSKATIDASTGVATGVSAGTSVVTFMVSAGCYATEVLTINSAPTALSGTATVCVGATTTLTSAPGGGSWTSGSSAATVSASGVVTGISSGIASITYTLATGCAAKRDVTVNAAPTSISGSLSACSGSGSTLSSSPTGGVWSSSNVTKATIGSSSGEVTGISAGTSRITYTTGDGCFTTSVFTVDATPAPITGSLSVCLGSTTTLSSATTGGVWSSGDGSIASISASTGVVSAAGTGSTSIVYTVGSCSATAEVTVNAGLAANTGVALICVGQSSVLSNATTGGTWGSSDGTVATVSGSGLVTGVSAGTANVTYTASAGCFAVTEVTISSSVGSISGSTTVCVGGTTTLSGSGSGTWSSSNTSKATVDASTGVVTGVSAGTTTITFMVGTSCFTTATIIVSGGPSAIGGTAGVCVGSTTALYSAPSGGTWTSSTSAATVGTSGVVTGASAGTTIISYTLSSGCAATVELTVTDLPSAIGGTLTTCIGSTTALSSTPSGGTWSSSTTAVATIGSSSGIATGVTAGTARITYTIASGCFITGVLTVGATPATISGSLTLCNGSTSALSSATTGGVWSSTDGSVATIDAGTGVVTAVGLGTSTISYSVASCVRTAVVTVGAGIASSTGTTTICVGQGTTLSNATGGGTWSSSDGSIATVNASTGVVTGIGAGTANITYTASGGCFTITVMTVSSSLSAITGTLSICQGATTTLTSGSGGAWSSSNTSKVTIDAGTGVATGVAAGTSTISYVVGSGCYATAIATVSTGPSAITGSAGLCVGSTTSLTSSPGGGTWSSSAGSIATASGTTTTVVVNGISAGVATISYTAASGCAATREVSVNEVPGAIGGSLNVCVGATSALTATPGGGVWTVAFTSKATINASTGVMTGVAVGTTRVTYTVAGSCRSIDIATVNAIPAAINVSGGSGFLCAAGTRTCTSTTIGGTWTSSNTAAATIHPSTGVLTGVAAGTTIISYSNAAGCASTRIMTVNVAGGTISGDNVVCVGQTNSTLTVGLTGGTWASSASAIANVHAANGLITGMSTGTANVTYTQSPGCFITRTVSVNAAIANIVGPTSTVIGNTVTLTNASPGGTWSSSNVTKATIVAGTGELTAVAAGTSTITYLVSTGCYRLRTQTMTYSRPGELAGSSVSVLTVYPNPTTGTVTIQAPASGTFAIYTVDSREVAQYAVTTEALTVSLPANLAAGVYMCRFTGEDGSTEVVRLVYKQ